MVDASVNKIEYFPCDECKEQTDAYWQADEYGTGITTGPNSSLWGPFILCKKCNDKYIDMLVKEEKEKKEMSHWNHRCMKKYYKLNDGSEEVAYGIVEAYYDDNNEIEAVTEGYVNPQGETIEELKTELSRMLTCIEKPILDEKELDEYFKTREKLNPELFSCDDVVNIDEIENKEDTDV